MIKTFTIPAKQEAYRTPWCLERNFFNEKYAHCEIAETNLIRLKAHSKLHKLSHLSGDVPKKINADNL